MNRISFVYLTATFMLAGCLITNNVYTAKTGGGSASSVSSGSTSTGAPGNTSGSSSFMTRLRDTASRITNALPSKKKNDSSKPGWVPPAQDRERFSRETQNDLENTAAQARARREKLEARVQELKTPGAPLTDDEQKALTKKIAKKESEATALREKEKNISERIAKATAPIQVKQPDGTFKEISLRDWDNMTARERKDAFYRGLDKDSDQRKAAKEAYMASLTQKEQREHKEHSDDRKSKVALAGGVGTIGALGTIGTIGASALISGGVAAVKAVSDDDDKKSSSGQAQVQIFEGGAQPTGSGVESGTFQPTGGTGDPTTTDTPSPADAGFTAVSPID
ncbi:hypothetical protein JST56_01415 [Candidatus Dependentiae bacterium]|nr:hypothetical protein [Candidatus Dependentiae bacterium]